MVSNCFECHSRYAYKNHLLRAQSALNLLRFWVLLILFLIKSRVWKYIEKDRKNRLRLTQFSSGMIVIYKGMKCPYNPGVLGVTGSFSWKIAYGKNIEKVTWNSRSKGQNPSNTNPSDYLQTSISALIFVSVMIPLSTFASMIFAPGAEGCSSATVLPKPLLPDSVFVLRGLNRF